MKQFIKWQNLGVDSVNGHSVQIIYTFSSFDQKEIDNMREWCKEHINAGLEFSDVRLREDWK